jgi:hypothetical protein
MRGDGGRPACVVAARPQPWFRATFVQRCRIRRAFPLNSFTLSSSHSGTVSIHAVAGLFSTNGQSTANSTRSIPISITEHSSAGLEKLPLVVM